MFAFELTHDQNTLLALLIAYPDEVLRGAAVITQFDLLEARQKVLQVLQEERHAERVLTLRRLAVSEQGTDAPRRRRTARRTARRTTPTRPLPRTAGSRATGDHRVGMR